MPVKYIKKFESSFRTDRDDTMTLLWGDPVQDLGPDAGTRRKVSIRGVQGTIDSSELTDTSLLEFYIIDVGQGDSVLFRTPDDKWHIVDGASSTTRSSKPASRDPTSRSPAPRPAAQRPPAQPPTASPGTTDGQSPG